MPLTAWKYWTGISSFCKDFHFLKIISPSFTAVMFPLKIRVFGYIWIRIIYSVSVGFYTAKRAWSSFSPWRTENEWNICRQNKDFCFDRLADFGLQCWHRARGRRVAFNLQMEVLKCLSIACFSYYVHWSTKRCEDGLFVYLYCLIQ